MRTVSPMQVQVGQYLRQPVGTVARFEIVEPTLPVGEEVLHDATGLATLLRTNRGLLVTLEVRANLREKCARCLKEISCPVEIRLEEEYIPVADPVTGERIDLDEESEDIFRIGRDFVLDLHEGLRQYTLMSEPVKPLCRPDCAGLCPNCGADLNAGPCRCTTAVDERWQKLAGLKRELEGS